ncbi:hypothetical protein S83_066306, partial [Arachis hypogaea]
YEDLFAENFLSEIPEIILSTLTAASQLPSISTLSSLSLSPSPSSILHRSPSLRVALPPYTLTASLTLNFCLPTRLSLPLIPRPRNRCLIPSSVPSASAPPSSTK